MTEYNIRLNPNCASAVHTGLKFKSGDKGITFRIAVDEMDTTGTTAKIVFLRANGTSVESDIAGTDGVYTYKTLGNEFAVPGKTIADVKFYVSGNRESTASFIFDVCSDTMDGLGAGTGGYSERLEQLVAEAESAVDEAERIYNDATNTANAATDTLNNTTAKATQTEAELKVMLVLYQNKFGEVGVLNPRGTYNSATTYEKFDLVYYGGVSWLCLKSCIGITPAEGVYWQLFASADGGNAAKFGGKLPSEYALGTDLANYLPKNDAEVSTALGSTAPFKVHSKTASSVLYSLITFINNKITLGDLGFNGANNPVFYPTDGSGVKKLLHEGNVGNFALLITGSDASTIKRANAIPISVENTQTNSTASYIGFRVNNAMMGRLGFSSASKPTYVPADGQSIHELLHTGNSSKVVKTTSAPSDTTAVWVDTANKKVKAYIDGAWTALA